MADKDIGNPDPRITMAEAARKKELIKKAFEEMQGAYISAFASDPPDEEKNAWANEKINVLEATISEAIVMVTAGDAWTRSEKCAVNDLNAYIASVDRVLEESYPRLRDRDGNTPRSALAESTIPKASPPETVPDASRMPAPPGIEVTGEGNGLNRTRRDLSDALSGSPDHSPRQGQPEDAERNAPTKEAPSGASTPALAAASAAGTAAKGAAAIMRMIGRKTSF